MTPPRRAPGAPAPVWTAVTDEALRDPANLARVLAGMGFDHRLLTSTRGDIRWWQPAYAACGPKAAATHRAMIGANNRARRDAEILAMLDGQRVFVIDTHSGEWRSDDGAQRGEDLISLGMLRWECRYGQAANRIARLIGITVPEIVRAPSIKTREAAHAG